MDKLICLWINIIFSPSNFLLEKEFLGEYLRSHFFKELRLNNFAKSLEKAAGSAADLNKINYIKLIIIDPPATILDTDEAENQIFRPLISSLFPMCNQETVIAMTIPDVTEVKSLFIFILLTIQKNRLAK